MIPIVFPHCAGLDVHKRFVVAWRLSVKQHGKQLQELRRFDTMIGELQELAALLAEGGVARRRRTNLQMTYSMIKRQEDYLELGAGHLDQLDR